MAGHRTPHLDALEPRRDPDTGADWLTLRHALGVAAFGINAWRAPETGIERRAVADEPGTTVLAIGAERGRIFTPSPWETDLLAAG